MSYLKRNGDLKMCMKLSELKELSANDLLNKAGQEDVVPVDIAQLCKDLQIITSPFDFTSIENSDEYRGLVEKKGNILGVVLAEKDDLAILYRIADTKNRKRFTIAHELAHCCLHMNPNEDLHIEFRTDEKSKDIKEIEANIFAGELLIPEKSLRTVIADKQVTEELVLLLSRFFVVSSNVMKERLKYLKIGISEE